MTAGLITPRASRELRAAASWVAEENLDAADGLLAAALAAAKLVTRKPGLARAHPQLAPERYRFWSLRGYQYLLVIDTATDPPVIARFLHQARDLPSLLSDL